jgi:hypothetical protein
MQLPPVHTPLTHPGAPFAGQGWPLVVKHVWMVTALQIWVVGLGQSFVTLQWTHRFSSASPGETRSHTGSLPIHTVMFVAVHCTQVWVAALQAGVPIGQSWSTKHFTQVWVVVSHAGVGVAHCTFPTHCTQEAAVPSMPSQTSPPVHGVPDTAVAHMPVAQELHGPLHEEVMQHVPPTQLPLMHWRASPVHVAPFAWAGAQWLDALQ